MSKDISNPRSALRVVGPYVIFGAAWILFSDRLLLPLTATPDILIKLSTAKGWLYVLVTAAFLYGLVLGEMRKRSVLEAKLREGLAEKEVLLAEVHHRVKNNLQVMTSILNLERDGIRGDEARLMNASTRARLRSMSLVHEQLYESPGVARIGLARYLRSLVGILSDVLEISRASIDYELDEVETKPDIAIPFGLFATEAVTNALRHGADDGANRDIRVELHAAADGMAELVVRDRGRGIPDGAIRDGLGFKLMGALAGQLRGSFDVRNDGGAVVRLEFSTGREQA
jgi:two-component sensor histidine kinase